ncbi:MAG TPA: hypothetical protein V6D20_02740 [Candidatus Obscuribacterales bacterium]
MRGVETPVLMGNAVVVVVDEATVEMVSLKLMYYSNRLHLHQLPRLHQLLHLRLHLHYLLLRQAFCRVLHLL